MGLHRKGERLRAPGFTGRHSTLNLVAQGQDYS